ncbi:MAG: DUF521 domain-containing protein [Firmicutes bacterium]|nr:DUF521 domain-containing protein [Bacillota bacterium]
MVRLTEEEKRMLAGEEGEAKRIALGKIIELAEILGAEELVPVTKAHLCCGSTASPADFPDGYLDSPETLAKGYDDWQTLRKCGGLDPKEFHEFNRDTFVLDDVHCTDSFGWEWTQQTKAFFDNNMAILKAASDHGVIVGSTCAPYLAGWVPTMGEVVVTTESSNVLYCNSVLGARCNGGGGITTFCAAICGRTPKWGLHLPENRHGTHVFHMACDLSTKQRWDVLGFAVGQRLAPNAIPVIYGDFPKPDTTLLKSFFTALATASGCEMCLIVGTSPEAQTYEMAMGGHAPAAEFTITDHDLDVHIDALCHPVSGPVDFLQIGCPNMTAHEMLQIARYMECRKVKEGVRFCVYTNVAQYAMAKESGIIEKIEKTGAKVLTSGCILRTINLARGAKGIGLSAGKLTICSKSEQTVPVYYGTDEEVCDAAVSGWWEVKRHA